MSGSSITLVSGLLPTDKAQYYGGWYDVLGWAAAAWWHHRYTDIPQIPKPKVSLFSQPVTPLYAVGESTMPHHTVADGEVWHIGILWWQIPTAHGAKFLKGILAYMSSAELYKIPMMVYSNGVLNASLSDAAAISDTEFPSELFNHIMLDPYAMGRISMLSRKTREMINIHPQYRHFRQWKDVITNKVNGAVAAKALHDMGLLTSANLLTYCRFNTKYDFQAMLETMYPYIQEPGVAVAIMGAYHDRLYDSIAIMINVMAYAVQDRPSIIGEQWYLDNYRINRKKLLEVAKKNNLTVAIAALAG